jgi:sirohydrochlorin cobaltochelatase
MVTSKRNAALLIVGHGSTVNPDSSAPSLAHAAEIRRRNLFADVACAFWKEEPSLRDAIFLFDDPAIREVYVVPNFISEGYFTETVIPRELELAERITTRTSGQVWKYCQPVGSHAQMTELLLQRAREIAPGVSERQISLLIVAHGTDLNDKSAVAAKREVEKIRQLNRYASVLNAYMEEAPLISDWSRLTNSKNVIVVPFFISDGLHSFEDIPVLLGIDGRKPNPHHLNGRALYYASAIGTDPRISDVILEQVAAFDRSDCVPRFVAQSSQAKA